MIVQGFLTIEECWKDDQDQWRAGSVKWTNAYPRVVKGPGVVTEVEIDLPNSALDAIPVRIDLPESKLQVVEAEVLEPTP